MIFDRKYKWILAAKRFMAEWHKIVTALSSNRHASSTCGSQGSSKGRDNSRRETAVDESRKEMTDRVSR